MSRIAFVNERMLRGFGVDLVIDSLARELSRRGHEVTVYASAVDDGQRPYKLDRIPTPASGVPPVYEGRAMSTPASTTWCSWNRTLSSA